MPRCGGLSPAPRRCGGGAPRLKRILESLNQQRGTGYDTVSTGNVYAENMAIARAIDGAWSTNVRLANQWNPTKMTTCLARWEKILGIIPKASDTDIDRRARITEIFSRVGNACNRQFVYDRASDALGNAFVDVEYIPVAYAHVTVPSLAYPFGVPSVDTPWTSTTSHVLVRTTKPSGMTEAVFLERMNALGPVMDGVLPAWVTWDWYRAGYTSHAITDGPSAAGFYLDSIAVSTAAGRDPEFNLSYQALWEFEPPHDSSLITWYRADRQMTTTVTGSTTTVTAWDAANGVGSAYQLVDTGQPRTSENYTFNSAPTVGPFTANLGTAGSVTTIAQPYTVYIVANLGTASTGETLLSTSSGNVLVNVAASANRYPAMYAGTLLTSATTATGASVICCVFNGGSSTIYVNDVNAGVSGAAGSASIITLRVGALNDDTLPALGAIAEVAICSGAHTSTQRDNFMRQYAGARYSITVTP